jgi:hypothetical protein
MTIDKGENSGKIATRFSPLSIRSDAKPASYGITNVPSIKIEGFI